jgi:hypothetical protein
LEFTGIFDVHSQEPDFTLSSLITLWVHYTLPSLRRCPSKRYVNLVIWSRSRVNNVFAWVSVSCLFFLYLLDPCNISLFLWLFFAIGSIHQEAQAAKFNYSRTSGFKDCFYLLPFSTSIVSCTSGLLRLQISSKNFQVQLLDVLPDFSGNNYCLHAFQVQL